MVSTSRENEQAQEWGMAFLIRIMRVTGPGFIKFLVVPVAFYYYLTSATVRKESASYLKRLRKFEKRMVGHPRLLNRPLHWLIYKHILSFSIAMVDRIYAWSEGVKAFDYVVKGSELMNGILTNENQGALFLVSHLGNFDLSIARSEITPNKRFNIIMDTSQTRMFNQFRDNIFNSDQVRFIEPAKITPIETMNLVSRVSDGEIVIIAADRIVAPDEKNSVLIEFLGDNAHFPSGPFVLAHLLEVPVYSLFSIKQKRGCLLQFELFEQRVRLPRKSRKSTIESYARKFASRLEQECIQHPFQWYNFYDFWAMHKSPSVK